MANLALIVLLAALMPHASAQKPISPPHFVSSQPGSHTHLFGYPIFFFSDYLDSAAGYSAASQPTVVVLQVPAANSEPAPVPAPAQPLLIELKGDRYIRVGGEASAGSGTIDSEPVLAIKPGESSTQAIPSQDLLPAVLVFRDGHREEVAAYTIADGVLYAQGNYYTDGSWNKKIELSSLNLPETIEASRSRGVHFQIPKVPNEVIVGP